MSAQMPSNISYNPVFSIKKNVLSDNSVIWEVWQRGSDQRLASAANELRAAALCGMLASALSTWEHSSRSNTVDA
jgi:hypothetical protein